jgi:copper chaperone CopZ
MQAVYTIEGMTCDGCRKRVEAALAGVMPGTLVTLEPAQAVFPKAVPIEPMNAALAGIGKYRLQAPEGSKATRSDSATAALPKPSLAAYYPLALISAYLVVVSFAGFGESTHAIEPGWHHWMTNFMAGFFLVFSFFKLLDIRGFQDAYAGYDLIAERWHGWGFVYPFVELGLGLAYLFRIAPETTNLITLVVMSVSILGVIRALLRRQTIRCACLGTVLNLPMSTVTLVEDGLMIAMAALMLIVPSV